jgi:hypothetical protein
MACPPDLDVFHLRSELRGVVETVKATLARDGVISIRGDTVVHNTVGYLPVLKAINGVLFGDMGFRGNLEDYYDPLNRCGIPARAGRCAFA